MENLIEGLEQFRQHLGGELAVPLLRGVGHAEDADQIPEVALTAAVEALEQAHVHAATR